MLRRHLLATACLIVGIAAGPRTATANGEGRRPGSEEELRFWLVNMLVHHRYTADEAAEAVGITADEIKAASRRLAIEPHVPREPNADEPLLVLPYPGGRHPRIGFLEGAVNPQRETKVSVFAPWKDGGYAVADVPEAIWHETASGRELLYLAHTHVPTIWDKQGIQLEPLEWRRVEAGWRVERMLPNKVVFGTHVTPVRDHVRMEMWLTNGTEETLRGLVVQNCILLKALPGFNQQTNDNKLIQKPFVCCHNADKTRWIITAWEPCHRPWANSPCPCLHSDPRFPDCEPGQTVRLRGWLSFYEGAEIEDELKRVATVDWLKP